MFTPLPTIEPLGDAALMIRFGDRIERTIFDRIKNFVARLDRIELRDVSEYVPGFTSVVLHYDPLRCSFGELRREVETLLRDGTAATVPSRVVEIPVLYGGEFGPDLDDVARHTGLSIDEVIALHSGGEYLVHLIGFLPGFPYLGGMPSQLATPRRATPRLEVPAGSVGIAGGQTGVYPTTTPGGWQIIGRTPLALFRPSESPPTLLRAGDVVRFHPITFEEYRAAVESAS